MRSKKGFDLQKESFFDAVRKKDYLLIEDMIEKGMDINTCDVFNNTAVSIACTGSDLRCLKTLLRHGANPNGDAWGSIHPLHSSVMNKQYEMCQALLEGGANVNATDLYEETSLDFAITHGLYEICALLVKHSADVRLIKSVFVELSEEEGTAERIHTLLLDNGLDINKIDLMKYISYLRKDIAVSLISKGARIDVVNKDDGFTLLHLAVRRNDLELAELLLDNGIGIEEKTKCGSTALHLAVAFNNLEIAKMLVKRGADLFALNTLKMFPDRSFKSPYIDIVYSHFEPWFTDTRKYVKIERLTRLYAFVLKMAECENTSFGTLHKSVALRIIQRMYVMERISDEKDRRRSPLYNPFREPGNEM